MGTFTRSVRQTSCKHCGFDIEGSARLWLDRGGDNRCPWFCGYDEDGVPVYRCRQRHEPQPMRGTPIAPTRWRPTRPGRPLLTQPR